MVGEKNCGIWGTKSKTRKAHIFKKNLCVFFFYTRTTHGQTQPLFYVKTMGIDGFGSFLRKTCPSVFQRAPKSLFIGKNVAVDMHLLLYQMFYRNGGVHESVLGDVRRFCSRLKSEKITAKLVFDGKTAGLKPRAHQMRQAVHERGQEQLEAIEAKLEAVEKFLEKAYGDLTKGLLEDTVPAVEMKLVSFPEAQASAALAVFNGPVIALESIEGVTAKEAVDTIDGPKVALDGFAAVEDPKVALDGVGAVDDPKVALDGVAAVEDLKVALDGVAAVTDPKVSLDNVAIVEDPNVASDGVSAVDDPTVDSSMIDGVSVTDIGKLLELQKDLACKEVSVSARLAQPTRELFAAVKELLTSVFGEDAVIVAEDDGERHVAALCASGEVDFAISSDYDTLAFGAPNLVIDFTNPSKTVVLSLEDVLKGLQLDDLKQFQDFCILCGCDFCEKVPGVGPVTALRAIRQYKTIEAMMEPVLRARIKKQNPATFTFDYEFARARYTGNAST